MSSRPPARSACCRSPGTPSSPWPATPARSASTTGSTPPTTTGPDQLVQTIEANFGIPIEHVVQIDFVGLEGAVDAIGGINIDFPYPAKDAYTGLNVTHPGASTLNGGYALAVARSRHYEY